MNYFDNEENILEWFRNTFEQQVLFPIENAECTELYLSLSDERKFLDWINSSGKGDPPPDFYNPKINMMMDVMRVDDHGHIVGKGKYINPVNQRESQIQRELRESGFLDMFPNVQSVFVNAVTDLSEREDHNYQFYVDNFKRTLEKHIRSIPLYRKNHPNYKVVFFVFDESCGYVVADSIEQAKKGVSQGEMFCCYPYICFMDKRFVDVFIGTDIDYVIWFSPYKHFDSDMPELPTVCVYDVKNMNLSECIDYPEDLMMSTEE